VIKGFAHTVRTLGLRTAVRTADVLTALAAVHRAVVVAHNLSILLFGVDLLPPPA